PPSRSLGGQLLVPRLSTPLAPDRLEDSPAVGDRAQPADPVDPRLLKAGDLANVQPCPHRAQIDHGLDLKAIAVEAQGREHSRPEGVVAVTQVAEAVAE